MRWEKWKKCFAAALMLASVLWLAPSAMAGPLEEMYADAASISPWAYDSIREATDKAFVAGSGGSIHPKGHITRAEFTKLMVSALGISTDSGNALPFDDVRGQDWFYPYVRAGYDGQLVSGVTDALFMPNGHITRQEMAAILVRALAIPSTEAGIDLQDMADVSPWAQAAVQTVVAAGLMSGDDVYFRPRDLATREMAFVVAMRAYRYAHTGHISAPEQPQASAPTSAAEQVKRLIRTNAAFMQHMVPDPTIGSTAGEWTILGLARSGEPVPEEYYAAYYNNVVDEVKQLMPATVGKAEGKLHRNKGTEHSRLILGLTSIGKRIDDVAGYDLRQALADFKYVGTQGINGPIFALIAFDSLGYDIPADEGVSEQTTRERLIAFILEREIAGGGWALGVNPERPDPDITAMAIQGLTPYYEQREDVREAIDRGVAWLAGAQDESGGFRSWGALNSESVAQVIVALAGLGIDAHTDVRFVKGANSALDSLLSFAAADGGFYHILDGESSNGGAEPGVVDAMATDQAMYALVAYQRFLEGQRSLYDMTDRIEEGQPSSSRAGR